MLHWTQQSLPVFRLSKHVEELRWFNRLRWNQRLITQSQRLDVGRNGILYPLDRGEKPIVLSSITDGTSNTIAIAEAVAVGEDNYGFWSCGASCLSHDEGSINNRRGSLDEIASLHPGGANAVFADGSVHFLSETLSLDIVAALCTRNNQEVVSGF